MDPDTEQCDEKAPWAILRWDGCGLIVVRSGGQEDVFLTRREKEVEALDFLL